MRSCEDEKMWRWADVKMSRCEDEKTWRWEDVKMSRCEDEQMRRCEDEKMWRWEDANMRRCEDVKMVDRPPLLEEPLAQTLSGKRRALIPIVISDMFTCWPFFCTSFLERSVLPNAKFNFWRRGLANFFWFVEVKEQREGDVETPTQKIFGLEEKLPISK